MFTNSCKSKPVLYSRCKQRTENPIKLSCPKKLSCPLTWLSGSPTKPTTPGLNFPYYEMSLPACIGNFQI